MKKYVVLLSVGLMLIFTACGKPEDQVLRFHVVANSDSAYDQQVKMKVKDAVFETVKERIQGAENKEQVQERIDGCKEEIQKTADQVLRDEGAAYASKVELGRFAFPTKQYGSEVFPAGDYDAVRVTLGEAKGQNWWCVMFPPICFLDAAQEQEQDWDVRDVEDVKFRSLIEKLLRKGEES